MESSGGEDWGQTQVLYSAWLACGDGEALEALCEEHPEQAERLRALHARYQRVGELLPLDSEAPSATDADAPFAELLERLRRHAPLESRYEEREEIGRGGMGRVVEVHDTDLRRSLAKKVMLGGEVFPTEAEASDPAWLGRFVEEAQITAQLGHPGVVPVHELGIDEHGRVFFTMELVGGRTLAEVFALAREGVEGWSIARAVGLLVRVCETIAYAHSKGVLHRDLKPANVMVGEFGEVYVMDWGLAKLVGQPEESRATAGETAVSTDRREASDRDTLAGLMTEAGEAPGTPGYMAPEQARGEVDALDARADVFSIGALLYVLLTGARPYAKELEARDKVRLFLAMSGGEFASIAQLAPDAPPELVSIAERAMQPERDGRYADAEALAADLRNWLEGRVVTSHEGGPWAELRKWVGRNKALAAALGGVALAILTGGGGMLVVEAQGRREVEAEQSRTLRLSDTRELGQLVKEEAELWPAVPAQGEALKSWLDRAEALLAEQTQHRADLALLRTRADAGPPAQEGWTFARQADAWQHDVLSELLARLESLPVLVERVRERHAMADELEARTLSGEGAQARWAEAIASIAEGAPGGGFQFEAQLGLLPLREDPASGLWEFWHVLSGAEPTLDPDTGRWRMEAETGVVLILIPEGTYLVGAPEVAPSDPRFDQHVYENGDEYPEREVELDAFFISKYELTRGQWLRAGKAAMHGEQLGERALPAGSISWDEGTEALRRLDLQLPTETQWEASARALVSTRFHTGDDWQSLIGFAHLLPDANVDYELDFDAGGGLVSVFGVDWQDAPLPVGSLDPNAFGLHDVHGNQWEWCLDVYEASGEPRDGDGLRESPRPETPLRTLRGASYVSAWPEARVTNRYPWARFNHEPDVGVRPARAVR